VTLTRSGPSLDGLLAALDAWADGSAAHDVATALAVEGQRLVREGFAQSKAPDGSRWAPLKRPRPGGPVLVKTRKLSAAAPFYTVDAAGFVMDAADRLAPYGRFHQTGAPGARLPRRPFYPDERLSAAWTLRLRGAADDALRAHLP
jgi:hypothetical protein